MKIYPLIASLVLVYGHCSPAAAQVQLRAIPEQELLADIQNRITINHDSGEKEQFTVTEKTAKAESDKLYHWYQSRRVHSTQGGYSGKLMDGNYSLYFNNKQLHRQGAYKRGLAHGQWKEWHANHRLAKEETWKKGTMTGAASQYDGQGQLLLRGKMKDAAWHGRVWAYTAADSSYTWTYYSHGKLISRESYMAESLFRRTGQGIGKLWTNLFRKKNDQEVVAP